MLLQELVEYSRRQEDIPPPMYNAEPVWYWVELDGSGRFQGLISAEPDEAKRPKKVSVPTLVRAYAIKPKLLADNAEYVLGIARESSDADRVQRCHRAFVELTRGCMDSTRDPDVAAVHAFLTSQDAGALPLPDDFDPTRLISFHVDGRMPAQLPSVEEFWADAASEGQTMQCLVCGRERPSMKRLQLKLKGVPGGQAAGLALISANEDAFTSYGLKASYVAPSCQDCSDRFMKAANQLIAGDNTHLRVGKAVYIFWTREPVAFSFASILSKPDPSQVRELLRSALTGRRAEVDPTPFYATALSASGGRAVVRDWIDTTVGKAQANLARFFRLQAVVDAWGEEGRPLGIYTLAGATVRGGDRDGPAPWVFKGLMQSAIAGGALPATLLFKAVERCRLEQGVTHPRAALIKMVLEARDSNPNLKGEATLSELDTSRREPAYLCGRLFAELEAVQRAALGDVGAGIVARYYGTASSAPATVFGRLVRGAQPHLEKLRRDRPGAYHALDERLQDINAALDSYPTTLTLVQQGLFALGYYQQRASDRRAARARRAPKTDGPEMVDRDASDEALQEE